MFFGSNFKFSTPLCYLYKCVLTILCYFVKILEPNLILTNGFFFFFLHESDCIFCVWMVGKWWENEGENAEAVKTRLRQWAQVVACSVRNSST